MRKLACSLTFFAVLAMPAFSQDSANPFLGRWDFNLGLMQANWLGVSQKNGNLEVWFQPTGGHVHPIKNFKVEGTHLHMVVSENGPEMTWDLDAAGGKLTGTQHAADKATPLSGVRAPALKHNEPKNWSDPEALFNSRNLDGWEPIGDAAASHWVVEDGLLVNQAHGANLKSTRKFEDFKLHFELNCPAEANSGFYLRGRYELQLEYEPNDPNPVERAMGSIYGRIAPSVKLPETPNRWESFDVKLVGRTVTVVRNGVTTINAKEIAGITGGALDANEGEPGPFYIQGDHTGGLKFRNITVSIPKK